MQDKTQISVIGAGLMGHGIAQVFAAGGHLVRVYDPDYAALSSVRDRVRRNLEDLGEDATAAELVFPVEDLGECVSGADVVIEAGPENLELKRKLFLQLELMAPARAILASNTSVIPITHIVQDLKTAGRAMGTHWWNPPYLVPLVEVVKTARTEDAAAQRMFDLLVAVGKTPAMVLRDIPGFIGNRLQHALWREAIALVAENVCDAETVDTVVKASFGRRLAVLGPLENADLVGIDLTRAIHETVLPSIDRTPGPSPYLDFLLNAGRLGMKASHGFRRWDSKQQSELRARVLAHLKAMDASEKQQRAADASVEKQSAETR